MHQIFGVSRTLPLAGSPIVSLTASLLASTLTRLPWSELPVVHAQDELEALEGRAAYPQEQEA